LNRVAEETEARILKQKQVRAAKAREQKVQYDWRLKQVQSVKHRDVPTGELIHRRPVGNGPSPLKERDERKVKILMTQIV